MLKAKNIKKSFAAKNIIQGINLSVNSGEILGLLGPNGAGKTTFFYILVGLLEASEGDIYLDNIKITKAPMHKRAQMGLCYLPQTSSIFEKMTVKENLLCTMEIIKTPKNKKKNILEKTLDQFSIQKIKDSYGYSLSGGERRRVEVARALLLEPKIILFDEPFAGVDPLTTQEIKKIMKSLSKKGIGIIISDHNIQETTEICDQLYILYNGKVLDKGKTSNVLTSSLVKGLYLGENFKYN